MTDTVLLAGLAIGVLVTVLLLYPHRIDWSD